jgi:hypothetical protein
MWPIVLKRAAPLFALDAMTPACSRERAKTTRELRALPPRAGLR